MINVSFELFQCFVLIFNRRRSGELRQQTSGVLCRAPLQPQQLVILASGRGEVF